MVARAESDVRTRIVDEATRLLAARGFDGTAVQDVADAVGVTKQAVLHHFNSKDQIREAVLGAILAHWKETLPRLLLAATASDDRFEAVFGELTRFFATDPNRARVVLREALDRPNEMRKLLRGAVRPWLVAVASYVDSGRASGRHFAEVDAEAYVLHILQLVMAAAASAPVTSVILDGDSRSRYDRELARIARASLFRFEVTPPVRAAETSRKTKR
jgi:TetR/AcrR family transcriptional regulator